MATKETKETKNTFPKIYEHKDSKSELMFANRKFLQGKVTIETKEEEELLKKTLDFQD
jgi:hypothetical protein